MQRIQGWHTKTLEHRRETACEMYWDADAFRQCCFGRSGWRGNCGCLWAYQLYFLYCGIAKNFETCAGSGTSLPLPIAWELKLAGVFSIGSSYSSVDEAVQCLAYSPDRSSLAIGSRDNHAYIFTCRPELPAPACYEYVQRYCCEGHSSFIVSLDWSADGRYLQTNDASRGSLLGT